MRTSRAIAFALAGAVFFLSTTWAAPPPQAEPPERPEASQTPEPSEPSDAVKTSEDPKASEVEGKKRPRREPVKIVDIAPETATHEEVESLGTEFKRIGTFRLRQDNALLVCDAEAKVIKVIGLNGDVVGAIELQFAPEALDIADDGTIYCGGQGQLAKLDADGRILKTITVPDDVLPKAAEKQEPEEAKDPPVEQGQKPAAEQAGTKAVDEAAEQSADEVQTEAADGSAKQPPENAGDQTAKQSQEQPAEDSAPPPAKRRRKKPRAKRISGIAASKTDVFVAFGSGWSTRSKSKLYRFDRDLEHPSELADGLRGCCQRCDILTRNGVLYLAENSAHRVVLYDREGTVLAKWGEQGRDNLETFGACCNPMNLCFDANGLLYTAESGLGRVKRYTADGQFVDLVGYVGTSRFWHGSSLAASCSNMTIAVTRDGKRVYVMDYRDNRIRVLQEKSDSPGDKDEVKAAQ